MTDPRVAELLMRLPADRRAMARWWLNKLGVDAALAVANEFIADVDAPDPPREKLLGAVV